MNEFRCSYCHREIEHDRVRRETKIRLSSTPTKDTLMHFPQELRKLSNSGPSFPTIYKGRLFVGPIQLFMKFALLSASSEVTKNSQVNNYKKRRRVLFVNNDLRLFKLRFSIRSSG